MASMMPGGIPIPAGLDAVLGAMKASGLMGESPVDVEKDEYFRHLMYWHCGIEFEVLGSADQKLYQAEDIESFMQFLFKKRTLLAASLINL